MKRKESQIKQLAKDIKKYHDRGPRDRLAKDIADIQRVSIKALDADPYILNTPGGIVDLRTGVIKANDPQKLCTKITAVVPSLKGMEVWEEYLDWLTAGDQELRDYIHQLMGLAVFGKVFGEFLHIAVGSGGNGKSTFFNAVSAVLGDYAGGMQNKTLLRERNQSTGADKATLRGKRLVLASELEEGAMLDAGQLKEVVSTDPVRGEKKYHDPEQFIPSHTTILFSNYLPRVESTDNGTWRRIRILEFKGKLGPEKTVLNYGDVLVEKAGEAILQWVIEGAVKVAQNDFKLPLCNAVECASSTYRDEQDWLPTFLSDRCKIIKDAKCRSSELSEALVGWCASTGNKRRNPKELTARLKEKGFEKRTTKGYEHWHGLRLRSPFDEPDLYSEDQESSEAKVQVDQGGV